MIKQAIGCLLIGSALGVIAFFLFHIAQDVGWKGFAIIVGVPCAISVALRAGFYLIGDKSKEGAQ